MNKLNVLVAALAVLSIGAAPPAQQAATQPCLLVGSWRIISMEATNEKGETRNELRRQGESYLIFHSEMLHFLQQDSPKRRDAMEYEIVRLNHNQDGWLDVWEPGAAANDRMRALFRFTNGRLLIALHEDDDHKRPKTFSGNNMRRIELIAERPDRLIANHIKLPDTAADARSKKDVPKK